MRMLIAAVVLLLQGAGTPRLANGIISGEIRSINGTSAAGLRVYALSAPDVTAAGKANLMISSVAQTDSAGRFRLEDLPAGRYYIMAGPVDVASYFPGVRTEAEAQTVTLTAGAVLSGVNFSLARPPGIRVAGRVAGFPVGVPAGLIHVNLAPQAAPVGSAQLDAPVQSDGTFVFSRVLPGQYLAKLTPAAVQVTTATLQVGELDINIELTMAAVIGRVVIDDGGKLPVQLSAAAARGNPAAPALIQLRSRRVNPAPAPAAASRGNTAAAEFSPSVRADGYFTLPVAAEQYAISATQLPFGYYIKTITPNVITSQLVVTLTTTPPPSEPPGVKLSGRIKGLFPEPGGSRWVRMQMSTASPNATGAAEQRIGEGSIHDDGTFEILRVPPGPMILQVLSSSGSGEASMQMRVVIGARDVTIDLEVATPRPGNEQPGFGPKTVVP